MSNRSILIIEDNKDLAELLAVHLRDLQYEVALCFDGAQGLQQASQQNHDLVILDLMLPGLDGLAICKALRVQKKYISILMLTAKSSQLDRINGLEVGADDYITKPFNISEMLARIKAIFRRMDAFDKQIHPEQETIIHHPPLLIDVVKHTVTINQHSIEITAKEFDLLVFFASQPGRVFSRNQLLDQVWGYGHDGFEHTVNSHINRLRMKIESNPKKPKFIQTVWGIGYKFSEPR